ncbi:TMEM165/GDT1 family protein [Neptuniibacter sp. QD48_11]|uniref:TMEM165/GDT1 family protein n=1 Tax=unclassified Neptuniibacter TaxID=2630693 RepID=UPI0039F47FD9
MDLIEPFLKVLLLIFLAEFGDKSQLVCMTLSARYKPVPVLIGAVAAFSVLNLLAVLFGATISAYLPQTAIFALVGTLFLVFGIQSLRVEDDEEEGEPNIGRHLLLSVFVLIFLAELGDKTQLSIAGLSAVENAWIVWLAGTSALLVTTLLGVWLGQFLLQRLSIIWIHRAASVLFIGFALVAFWQLAQLVM